MTGPLECVVVGDRLAALVDQYLAGARDAGQRQQLVNLACLLRHSTAYCKALADQLADFQLEAVEEWSRAHGLALELADAEAEITALRSRLAEAEYARDTAKAVGGQQ